MQPKQESRETPGRTTGTMSHPSIAALCKGVRVPHSPFLNETRIRRIQEARYEGEEIAGALHVVRQGDRVLEMGAGLGVVSAVTALNARPARILSFEANPALIPHIRALHAANDLQDVIDLRNQVLLSAPDRPETMTFFVTNSFLGSSLIDKESRKTQPVEIPTADYHKVLDEFRPDVLLMDIEGGELDFLAHADLRGIRAIVIEFHPAVYGKDGAQRCKDALRAQGFEKLPDLSTRFVWTCTRALDALSPPDPDGGWATQTVTLEQAHVLPPVERKHVQATGVLDSYGKPVPQAMLWRGSRLLTLPPSMPRTAEKLPGKWLWGGTLWRYFPHFITESVTRLWALDGLDQSDFDGILFVPKNPTTQGPGPGFQRGFLDLMGCRLPIHEARVPLQVEQLVVPGQGFGLGEISRGTGAFRAAIAERFAPDVAPDGPDRLYISRSRLGPARGALLGEEHLEQHLSAQGYEIFHPQEHPLEVQIARYRAAKQVIAAEGSALHLYAFAARPQTDVAMILRRKSQATRHISTHIQSFAGTRPLWVDRLRRMWRRTDTPRKRLWIGEPDFAAMQADLVTGGFVAAGPIWTQPPESELKTALGPDYALVDRAA